MRIERKITLQANAFPQNKDTRKKAFSLILVNSEKNTKELKCLSAFFVSPPKKSKPRVPPPNLIKLLYFCLSSQYFCVFSL